MKLNVQQIKDRKGSDQPLAMLTAYDAQTALLLEQGGLDLLLVGDTLGMVFQGRDSTRVVTLDQMAYHVSVVSHGAPETFIVGDLPFGTYDSPGEAVSSARRLLESGANAVKLEGNPRGVIEGLVGAGIPVMGHLGLQPQTAESFSVRGKREQEAEDILEEAVRVERAGAFSLVLESVPESLARRITERIAIPTIGIGAGKHCDGQVLVVNDMLGLSTMHQPKFVKHYAELASAVREAAQSYVREVRSRSFPDAKHTYH